MKKFNIYILGAILLFLSIILPVNGATEYLNSCGKSSGWTTNNEYIVNFSEIPAVYGNNYCFQIDTNNITIYQNPSIPVIKNLDSNIVTFVEVKTGTTITKLIIENITILDNYGTISFYSGIGRLFDLSGKTTLKNISLYNGHSFLFWGSGATSTSDVEYINLENIFFTGDYFLFNLFGTSGIEFRYNNITNSVIYVTGNTTYYPDYYLIADWHTPATTLLYNKFDNCVLNDRKIAIQGGTYGVVNTYSNINRSIVSEDVFTDANNDGFADSDTISGMYSMRTYYDLFGVRFLQDVGEGSKWISTTKINVPVSSDSLGFPDTWDLSSSSLNYQFATGIFSDIIGIKLNSNSELLSLFPYFRTIVKGNNLAYFEDTTTTFTYARNYNPFIAISGNNILIDKIYFLKNADTNKGHPIADYTSAGTTRTNIQIKNSYFEKSDRNYIGNNTYIIRLKGNGINIENVTFNSKVRNVSVGHELLYVSSLIPTSNVITNNTFITNTTTGATEIFSSSGNVVLSNNYIGTNVKISNNPSVGISLNPLIAYPYNNYIYYFRIGNYYADNVGCSDSDSNDICDSSYSSGVVIDQYPIVSYPYDFEANLLNALYSVENTSFSINVNTPKEGYTYNVTDSSSTFTFLITQTSSYPDLNCVYVIDGTSAETNYAVSSSDSLSVTGLSEGSHTFFVECSNEFISNSSTPINFNIAYTGETTPSGGGISLTGQSSNFAGLDFNNLFSSDISTSINEIPHLFNSLLIFSPYLFYLGIIFGAVLLIIIIIGLPATIIKFAISHGGRK